MTTSFGPVREVMFAPVSNPTDVNSFLIRDDAYAKSSAVLGRTLRLGDPIDTGVISAAYQTSWSGGRDQTHFTDTSMYLDSTLDTTDFSGRLKMWPGFYPITSGGTEYVTSIINSPSGINYSDNKFLFSMSTGAIFQRLVDTPYTQTNVVTFAGEFPTVMSSLDQTYVLPGGGSSQQWAAVGFRNGNLKIIETNVGTIEDRTHPTTAERANIFDMCVYNKKMAVVMGASLFTMDLTAPGAATWVKVHSFSQAISSHIGGAASLAVHGGTLYILIQYRGGVAALWSSDGVSGATLVHKFDNSYVKRMHSLKGGLYIHMNENAFTNTEPTVPDLNLVLYSYGGGVLRKLTARSDAAQYFTTAQSDGPSCVWGDYIAISYYSLPKAFNSSTEDRTIGFLLYNPENDSFHMGPSLRGCPSGTNIVEMNQSNGALYFNLYNGTNNVLANTLRSDIATTGNWSSSHAMGVGIRATEQKYKLISSTFDGGFPDLQKTWLRVNVKHNLERGGAAGTVPTMNVYVRTSSNDYDSTEYLIGTYSPPVGAFGWRTSSFDISVSGVKFPKTNQLRYVVELKYPFDATNPTYGNVDVEKAQIDSVSVEYMLVASPKRVWRTRVLAEDVQPKLSGTSNALTTRTSLSNKLFEYWTNGQPLYYWDASPSSVTPTYTSGVPTNHTGIIMITDVGENSYRINDLGNEVVSELSLTMYEVA
jgi:hypothetical protein